MSSKLSRLFGVAVALSCAGLVAVAQDEKAGSAVEKLADDATKKDWKAVSEQGKVIAKESDLLDVMNLFRKRKLDDKGNVLPKTSGLGFGKVPGQFKDYDGIEVRLQRMSKTALKPDVLAKEQAELIRMAERMAAIAAITVHQCPVDKKKGEMDPAAWKQWMEDMHKGSLDMIKAVQAKKPADLLKAVKAVQTTCTECHGTFKDKAP